MTKVGDWNEPTNFDTEGGIRLGGVACLDHNFGMKFYDNGTKG